MGTAGINTWAKSLGFEALGIGIIRMTKPEDFHEYL